MNVTQEAAKIIRQRRETRDELVELIDDLLVDDGCPIELIVTTSDRDLWDRSGQHIGPRDVVADLGCGCALRLRLSEEVAL